jgi:hypothetical protein
MKEVFRFLPPGAVPSPDQSVKIPLEEITQETKHPHAVFAVMLAHSIRHFDPLLARLRDPSVKLEWYERKFLADNWDKQRPGGKRLVEKNRKWLGIAAHYLEFGRGEPGKGRAREAEDFAAGKYNGIDPREVRRAVKFAKTVNYGTGRWWDLAVKMAREGKIEKLHRTY